jgi:hypothetical protein
LEYLYFCRKCRTTSSYLIQIWYIWSYIYFENIFMTISAIFEIAATFNCYISISAKFEYCQTNLFFYIFSTTVILLVSICYIILPLGYVIKNENKIDLNNDNETYSYFSYEYNDFGSSKFYSNLFVVNIFTKD